ncbi:MAG: hypothetical protein GF411_13050 [Candidatus Lokiarchaeota archaeon]|nr:hypothetical protein [Candidatus Lokiarchaeota archaeon]
MAKVAQCEANMLGIIQDSPNRKDSSTQVTRILFRNNGSQWEILNTMDKLREIKTDSSRWTIINHGQSIGKLIIRDDIQLRFPDCDWCFTRDKLFRPIFVGEKIRIPDEDNKFGDWVRNFPNRPLVIVSQPQYADEEKWAELDVADSVLANLYPKLKEIIKHPHHCEGPPDYAALQIELKQSDIEAFTAYSNNRGDMLVSASFHPKHLECDGPLDKTWYPIWFFVADRTEMIGFNLEFLDAGDYDGDGKTEVIFEYTGYNEDGYVLYEPESGKKYEYLWKYH